MPGKVVPNRVPRLRREAIASLHDIIVKEVMASVIAKREEYFAEHRNDRTPLKQEGYDAELMACRVCRL